LSRADAGTVAANERIRLFCALCLPPDVLDAIVEWQQQELGTVSSARIIPRPNLHVTLAFLGWWPAARLDQAVDTLRRRAGDAKPPVFAVERYRETRSVGMLALSEDRRAARLAYVLQRDLLGGVERRPWLAHVTVLRFHKPPRLRPPVPDLGVFSPSEAAVYHSVLRSTGAQYEVLESVALGG
jgi:RNA 2',3'-cyclic 3'-phosphodiesterase